jgi:hypothetical protein
MWKGGRHRRPLADAHRPVHHAGHESDQDQGYRDLQRHRHVLGRKHTVRKRHVGDRQWSRRHHGLERASRWCDLGTGHYLRGRPGAARDQTLARRADYHGRWQGDWTAVGCNDDGDWRGACAEFPSGSLWALWLDLTQTRDAISGKTDFGDGLAVAVAGTIMMIGPVVLNGTSSIVIEDLPMEATVSDWETMTTDNERMTGRFRFTIRAAGVQGSLGLQGEARIVTKTSTITSVSATEAAGGFRGVIARSLRRK